MDPAERQEIIAAFRYEFQTFKDEQFQPLTDAVRVSSRELSKQGRLITANTTEINIIRSDVKENRSSIGRLLGLIVSSLITILGVVLGINFLFTG